MEFWFDDLNGLAEAVEDEQWLAEIHPNGVTTIENKDGILLASSWMSRVLGSLFRRQRSLAQSYGWHTIWLSYWMSDHR